MKTLIRILLVFIFALPVAACSSNEEKPTQKPSIEKPGGEEEEESDPENNIPPNLADSSFTYYNRAFLLEHGNRRYYRAKLSSDVHAYFWNQALIILMIEDRYEFRKDENLKSLINDLLYTFLENEKNPTTNDTKDWTWNRFNDDLLWAGLAFIRGYQITGEERFLIQAEWTWDFLYSRGYTEELGGGIWWDTKKESKSALSNNPAVSMACYLYEATGKKQYLEQAKSIYHWVCTGYQGKALFNPKTGAVDEKMNPNGTLSKSYNVYTSGAFIEGANALYRNTKYQMYYDHALKAIDYVINNKTTKGIISKRHMGGTWQSEFARGMGMFVKDNNLWNRYYDWMLMNAKASWKTRNKTRNITGNEWLVESQDRDWEALECVSAVVMTQVVPDTKP